MNKLAMMILATSMALGSSAVFAAGTDAGSNNGAANQSDSPGSVQKIAPKSVDNSKINNTDKPVNEMHKSGNKKVTDHKKTMCKDGRCPDQVPGNKQSKATGN